MSEVEQFNLCPKWKEREHTTNANVFKDIVLKCFQTCDRAKQAHSLNLGHPEKVAAQDQFRLVSRVVEFQSGICDLSICNLCHLSIIFPEKLFKSIFYWKHTNRSLNRLMLIDWDFSLASH